MPEIDTIIHQPARLKIMASLMTLEPGEQVEQARYIKVEKTFIARKPRSFISMTTKGRSAFENHVAALEEIVHSRKKTNR